MEKNGSKAAPVLISFDGKMYGPPPADMPPRDDYLGPVKPAEVTFKCGHTGPAYYAISAYGLVLTVRNMQANDHIMCPDCLVKKELKDMTRCGVCGGPIVSDTKVFLYRDVPGLVADAKRIEHEGQTCVMGCQRCAPKGAHPVGTWDGERFVPDGLMMLANLLGLLEVFCDGDPDRHTEEREPSPEECARCEKENCSDRLVPYAGDSADIG